MKKCYPGCAIIHVIGASASYRLLLYRYGIDWHNEGGSHHVFSYPGVVEDVCVPVHRPIKPVYVRRFVTLVDKVKELQR